MAFYNETALTEAGNIYEIITAINTISNNWFGIATIIVIYIIYFTIFTVSKEPMRNVLTGVSFVVGVLGILFFYMTWIPLYILMTVWIAFLASLFLRRFLE